jgi:hypothetical protein
MNLDEIKNLDLSVADFDLLIQGLDQLPRKHLPGSIVGSFMGAIGVRNDRDMADLERKIKREFEQKDKEAEALKEDTTILKAKLITLKRFMAANDLLKQAKEILK